MKAHDDKWLGRPASPVGGDTTQHGGSEAAFIVRGHAKHPVGLDRSGRDDHLRGVSVADDPGAMSATSKYSEALSSRCRCGASMSSGPHCTSSTRERSTRATIAHADRSARSANADPSRGTTIVDIMPSQLLPLRRTAGCSP